MSTNPAPRFELEPTPPPIIVASVDIGRNALWNYVTLVVWLRWLRRLRAIFNVLPVLFGSLGSWRILTQSSQHEASILTAALAFLAGILPLLYFASGVDQGISNATRLCGRYRVLEAKIRDLVIRSHGLAPTEIESIYEAMLADYLELKGEAHTVPQWAFDQAERLIAKGDYAPISLETMAPLLG